MLILVLIPVLMDYLMLRTYSLPAINVTRQQRSESARPPRCAVPSRLVVCALARTWWVVRFSAPEPLDMRF